MSVSKVIARAWTDLEFKNKLLNDPNGALAEHGVDVPAGTTVKVVENTGDTVHLVLPSAPDEAGEVTTEDLERTAGGLLSTVGTGVSA